jgi:hypothetical protein
MQRSLGRCARISFVRILRCCLASVVVVILVAMTPIPVGPLIPHLDFDEGTVGPVSLDEILAVHAVFVAIPIVVIPVIAVENAVVVIVAVFFLTPVVLPTGGITDCRGRGKGCRKKNGTEKVSISTSHVASLLAKRLLPGIPCLQGVCIYSHGNDVR